jgi:endonuclease YncB( thermonuclease family)
MDSRTLGLLLALLAVPAAAQTVVDGDTIKLEGTTIRIWGIDAAETKQACADGWMAGREATAPVMELVKGRAVACEAKATDRYGRTVALCP